MKITIHIDDFIRAFQDYNRADNFTREALEIIFDYFEECDPDYELDVICICCEFSEGNAGDIINDYSLEYPEDATEEELNNIARDYLNENTCIIGKTSTGFVYLAF